jgi:membrane dipeptidase
MASGISERGEAIEAEFIADPHNSQKRQAWHAVVKELEALPRPSYTCIADHIDHVVSLVGINHVGIGSDFDGIEVTPDGLENISMLHRLFEELRKRGYSEEELEKIASKNFFNALSC